MRFLISMLLLVSFGALAQSPDEYPGLQLWLRADAGIVMNESNQVELWQDQSGNGNDADQAAINFRPIFTENVINGLPAVHFDGDNDRLNFDDINDIRTVFWVISEDEDAIDNRVPLLCHSATFDFHRGEELLIWHPNFSDESLRNGVTRLNQEEIDGTIELLPSGHSLVSLVSTDVLQANRFSYDRTFGNRIWDGDLVELLIYNEPLDPSQVEAIETYLIEKYSPELSVSEDQVIDDGFCAVDISANEGFNTYLWSTGDTESTISVNNTGSYWVEATDVFGRVQRDTVEVQFPGNTALQDTGLICVGDSVQWDLQLPTETYSIEWFFEGQTTSAWFKEAGDYFAMIQDAEGCELETPYFTVVADSFPVQGTLGPDLSLCVGNTIALFEVDTSGVGFSWNETPGEALFEVQETGEVTLEATNQNGCVVQDTIYIEVLGEAPEVAILAPPITCEALNNEFSGSAIADSPIQAWNWLFNDEFNFEGQAVSWEPEFFGESDVSLEVVAESGCATTVSLDLLIQPLPSGEITVGQACTGAELLLSTVPQIAEGSIQSTEWVFAGEAVEGQTVTYIPTTSGFTNAELTITSTAGCVYETNQMINVLQTPSLVISVDPTCLGSLTSFEADAETTESGPITDWYWTFGDTGFSTQDNPQHIYPFEGFFDVEVSATAENGCVGRAQALAEVIPLPQADFVVSNACQGESFNPLESSDSVDPIVEWNWSYENLSGEGQDFMPVFTTLGFNALTLEVVTENGCVNSLTQQVPVFELPEPSFSFNPLIGAPPLEVQFVNESIGAVAFAWNFGNGQTSSETNPTVIYEEEGNYEIKLTAQNTYGCQNEYFASIDVTEPITDIQIISAEATETPFGMQISALLTNRGNYPVNQVAIRMELSDGSSAVEMLDVPVLDVLQIGQFVSSSYFSPSQLSQGFICVEAEVVEPLTAEATPDNNKLCVAAQEEFVFVNLFPNPLTSASDLNFILVSPTEQTVNVSIWDATGKQVQSADIFRLREGYNAWKWQVPELRTGIYTVRLEMGENVETQRLMVE